VDKVLTPPASLAPPIIKAAPHDKYASQIRLLVALVLSFAVLPAVVLISVGILVLVFGHQPHDYVFGTLILSLTVTLIAGITATVLYVRRGTSLARLQAEFVQKVSHDLRTPLTSIRMFVETLQGGRLTDPEKVAECLEVLANETGRLTSMVERLLRWASMEAGKRTYLPVATPIEEVVDAALDGCEPQIKIAEMQGTVSIDRPRLARSPNVLVDPDAMSEALINVLQNAVRYTGRDKRLRIACAVRERDVVVSITDNGPGIPKHEQGRIFEKFHRVVDPANPNIEGTGLGLAIVHHIVRAHLGSITVDSEPGHGATFHIALPMAPPVGAAAVVTRGAA
jgi:two-component system phosphate regulon sensor histidine kinase PhoR